MKMEECTKNTYTTLIFEVGDVIPVNATFVSFTAIRKCAEWLITLGVTPYFLPSLQVSIFCLQYGCRPSYV
jgi:hypothetical protein